VNAFRESELEGDKDNRGENSNREFGKECKRRIRTSKCHSFGKGKSGKYD
jgi:hypothetical protein